MREGKLSGMKMSMRQGKHFMHVINRVVIQANKMFHETNLFSLIYLLKNSYDSLSLLRLLDQVNTPNEL
jgi:hypothetical protein